MVQDTKKATWKYVIVYSLDRFASDRYDSAVYKRKLKECGVKVISAMENISDDPTGVLMESVIEGMNEYHSKELSRKIKRGQDDNASKCMINGAVPLGYKRGEDGRYEIVECEAQVVREIFERVNNREMFAVVIDDLNSRGILTKTKKRWNKFSFNKILSNVRYKGIYIWKDYYIPDGIPRIISDELFDSVQALLGTKGNARGGANPQRRRQDNNLYLLTGKLFCGKCKSPMVGTAGTGRHGGKFYYYNCKAHRTQHTCDKKPIRQNDIEQAIAIILKSTVLTDEVIDILADLVLEYQAKNIVHTELKSLEARQTDTQRSLKNIMNAIESGIVTETTKARLLELEQENKMLNAQIAFARSEIEKDLTKDEIIAVLSLYKEGNVQDKEYQEALIDTFLVSAYVYDDFLDLVFSVGNNKKQVNVPFNAEDIDWDALESMDWTSLEGVRTDSSELHHKNCHPKRVAIFYLY